MNPKAEFETESLPSGKKIVRRFDGSRRLVEETHSYGVLGIAIQRSFVDGDKTSECYFANRRLVSRGTYEKERLLYPDMPAADFGVDDFSGRLTRELRVDQQRRKSEKEKRLSQSEEARFLKPKSTNWIRVIAEGKARLVEFASRDWKMLSKERELKTGREWLEAFGFHGRPQNQPSVHKGIEIGYEIEGNRAAMLETSKKLLDELIEFAKKPAEPKAWLYSFAPRRKSTPKRQRIVWLVILPPLVEFLSGLSDSKLKVFNHHQ